MECTVKLLKIHYAIYKMVALHTITTDCNHSLLHLSLHSSSFTFLKIVVVPKMKFQLSLDPLLFVYTLPETLPHKLPLLHSRKFLNHPYGERVLTSNFKQT